VCKSLGENMENTTVTLCMPIQSISMWTFFRSERNVRFLRISELRTLFQICYIPHLSAPKCNGKNCNLFSARLHFLDLSVRLGGGRSEKVLFKEKSRITTFI
jgi:hypothetical protein